MRIAATALALVGALAATGVVESAEAKAVCTRGADARTIEIISPGVVGESCDVRYTRSGNASVPYHADNASDFCARKARELATRLAASGFVCVEAAPALRADTSPPASDFVVEAKRAETEPEAAASDPAPQETLMEEPAPVEVAAAEPAPSEPPAAATEPLAANHVATEDETGALEDEMSRILAQPVAEPITGEPAQLVAQRSPPPSQPQATPVGRMVGAEPEEPRPAIEVTQASLQETAPAPEANPEPETKTEPAPQPAAAPQQAKKTEASKLREPADVIRATLRAQIAAWNEGDLDGFMDAYWKSDDLKFVSGVNVTKGWNATMKRYRDRYAGGEGLGQLGFEKLDVEMLTDDVATVTGRFNLARGGETSSGAFSLVMRRDAGAWKIVHDHTTPDPAP
ncbi:MAG: hypothetical protein CMI63_08760 [Parvularcula sp.]|nr:hypothetical protein [Parvularcula sp.]